MLIPSATIGLATPVADGATGVSNVINTQGLNKGSAGLISSHAGTLSVQRYSDAQGLIPVGAALTVALVATVGNAVGWSDGLPIGSIQMSLINGAGAAANLTSITVNLGP
jgi:hypothetical protein